MTKASSASRDKNSDPERRAQILDSAERLLSHYGPAKTTIGDIAREAGIGVGSVYLEFGSKDEIVGELSARRHRHVLAAMREAAASGPYAERLAHALEARIQAMLELSKEGAHSCDLVLCSSSPVKAAYGRFREEEIAFVAKLLEDGTRAGELCVKQPRKTAELLQRAYASFSPPWLFHEDKRELFSLVRAMNDILLRGVVQRRS